jgi:hypothetical protein
MTVENRSEADARAGPAASNSEASQKTYPTLPFGRLQSMGNTGEGLFFANEMAQQGGEIDVARAVAWRRS